MAEPPLLDRTPVTLKGRFLMRIVWPVGSSPPGMRGAALRPPTTPTLAAPRTSASVNVVPLSIGQSRMANQSCVTPWIVVLQLAADEMTCAEVRVAAEDRATAGHSFLIASASSPESV